MEMFLSFILFIVIGFWLLGIIGRWALRSFILRKQREMEEQFGSGGGSQTFGSGNFRGFYTFGGSPGGSRSSAPKSEGEITVERNQEPDGQGVSKKIGEYVEFEEIAEQE